MTTAGDAAAKKGPDVGTVARTLANGCQPPHSIDLEQALLGAILVNNAAFPKVSKILDEPDHFFEPLHQAIYEIAAELLRAGKVANPLTIAPRLPAGLQIKPGFTANQYLARLAAEATTVINAPDYAREIVTLSQRRHVITILAEVATAAYGNGDLQPIMDAAKSALEEIGTVGPATAPPPFIHMSTWDDDAMPDRLWAIPDRVPLNQAGLFSGEGGTGKSILELHKDVAHVAGKDWLGSLPEQGPAIYIGAEDDEREIRIRLAAIAKHCGVTFADLIKGGLHIMSLIGKDATLCTVSRVGKVETTALYRQLYQAAGDIKPKNISIDTLSRAFAGSEIDRVQVYGFASHMQALAMVAGGSVTILSHPSLSGINSGSGISGSTAWHGAFRFRQYLTGIKSEAGEQPDNDLRQLEFKKNQYGPTAETIVLRYRDGLFLPLPGASSLDKAAHETRADNVFLDLLLRFTRENRNVGHNSGTTYAPAIFAKEDEATRAGINKDQLKAAMRRLFAASKIWNEPYGKLSRPHYRLAIK